MQKRLSGDIWRFPMHSGDIKRGLLMGIIKQAGMTQEEFIQIR